MRPGNRQRLRYKADGRVFVDDSDDPMAVGAWKAPSFLRPRTGGVKACLSWTESDDVVEFQMPALAPTEPAADTHFKVDERQGRRLSLAPPPVRGDSLLDCQPLNSPSLLPLPSPSKTGCTPSAISWDSLEEDDIGTKSQNSCPPSPFLPPPGCVEQLGPSKQSELMILLRPEFGNRGGVTSPTASLNGSRHSNTSRAASLSSTTELESARRKGEPHARTTALQQRPGMGVLSGSASGVVDPRKLLMQARSMRSFKRVQRAMGPRDWRRQRDQVELWLTRWNLFAALCGLCGVVAACLQHELVVRGWEPTSFMLNALKIANSCFTCILIGKIWFVVNRSTQAPLPCSDLHELRQNESQAACTSSTICTSYLNA